VTNNLIDICTILNKHQVQYLVIGGFAVGLHGYSRMTTDNYGKTLAKQDYDFWYNPTYENYFNLINALEKLGEDVLKFREDQTPNPLKSFFKLKFDKFTLDFLPTIIGLEKFIISFEKRDIVKIEGTEISFISFDDLIKNKQATARPKDIDDINQLNLLRNSTQ
jgi:hypothetical protein